MLDSRAKDDLLLQLIQEKFSDGDALANWIRFRRIPFKHVSDYIGSALVRQSGDSDD